MRSYRGARVFQASDSESGAAKAAIVVFNPDLNVVQHPELTTTNIAVIEIRTEAWRIALISYYFEPNSPIEPYLDQLSQIVRTLKAELILGGDSNAKSNWWGSITTDQRGEDFAATLHELDLHVLNDGVLPTFDTIRGRVHYKSHVDVTACSVGILNRVVNWKVVEDLTSSDHNGIMFGINYKASKGIKIERTTRIYNTKKANWAQFNVKMDQIKLENKINLEEINKLTNSHNIDLLIGKLTKTITESSIHAIPKKKNKEKIYLPWWSEELGELKSELARRKRRIRCAAPIRRPVVVEEYLEKKIEYETKANEAQVKSWKEFCKKQDRESVWDGIYRVIGRVTKREEDALLEKEGKTLNAMDSAKLLAESFFPMDLVSSDSDYHKEVRKMAENVNKNSEDDPLEPPLTMTELKRASASFNPKKAPGVDGFTADICLAAINNDPNLFLSLYNKCFDSSYFPKAWKEAVVVVLKKPGKSNYKEPKSFRPIGLLPILGKIYEKMLVYRLRHYILPRTNGHQYGFMPQRSTEDSLYALMRHIREGLEKKKLLTVVSLDIEGAFDNAWWPALKIRLKEEQCPVKIRKVFESYLADRAVKVRYGGVEATAETTKGCIQGSIAGPTLWNLLLDPLLNDLQKHDIYCQAFADDVVLVFEGTEAIDVERKANMALQRVEHWGKLNKLKFAAHKTNAMVITRKLKHDNPRLSMGGIAIEMVNEIKILGVIIDSKLTFNTHISNQCQKAIRIYKKLAKAARASWGLSPEIVRTIYVATVEPVLLYAASVWAPATTKLCIKKKLNAVQRGFAQKICKAYRTVSLHSALLLAGLLPLDLRIREVASLYEARKGAPLPGLGDREIERMESAISAPHPAEYTELHFTSLVDEEQLLGNSNFEVKIYTDGSKIDGRVGAALSIWIGESEAKPVKLCLPSYCTVYQAELLAVCEATKRIVVTKAHTFGIYSDSMSALQTITNLNTLHPLAVETRRNLKLASQQNKRIEIFWIKAHAGMEGNERADALAKEAAVGSKKKPDYDLCPVSFVKKELRHGSIIEWDKRYREGETAKTTKIFFPSARLAYKTTRKLEISFTLTQMLTGHGGFAEYLHRFKCGASPSCQCDPNVDETVPHLLTECPAFGRQRLDIETKIDCKISVENLPQLIMSKRNTGFMQYCTKIICIVNKRNSNK